MVHVLWGGEEYALDLYSTSLGTRIIQLDPHLDWSHADLTRKILVAGAFITDLIGLASILFSAIILITQIFSFQKLFVRKRELLILCLVAVFVLQFAALKVDKSIVFENPQIEAG